MSQLRSPSGIDLLPDSIRRRTQAGMRMGRYIAAAVAGVAIVIALSTHARLEADRANVRLEQARHTADLVLRTEQRGRELRADLRELERTIALHERLSLPLNTSSILATLANRLPSSVSLDRLELRTETSRGGRRLASAPVGIRAQGASAGPRQAMSGEISGFAASDEEVAALIAALRDTPPLDAITLDFSRTRTVRGHAAREFRMSFRFDLDSVMQAETAGMQ